MSLLSQINEKHMKLVREEENEKQNINGGGNGFGINGSGKSGSSRSGSRKNNDDRKNDE